MSNIINTAKTPKSPIKQDKNAPGRVITAVRNHLVDAALQGNLVLARHAIDDALLLGLEPKRLYGNLLIPAVQILGELCATGKISIAEEHMATDIISSALTVLRSGFKPERPNGFSVVMSTLAGDLHTLGLRIISDYLLLDGWQVSFLGANTPTEELLRFVKERKPEMVALSVSNSALIEDAANLIRLLKNLPKPPKVLVGGMAINSLNGERQELGADSYANSADAAVHEARRLMNIDSAAQSLEDLLKDIGQRIKQKRASKALNQTELSRSSKLDRAYLSAIENGKQNITLGALLQIASALDTTVADLVSGERA